MLLQPRILVADNVSTNCEKNNQFVDLITLSRDASADFYNQFPDGEKKDLSAIMAYARMNALTYLGRRGVSQPARGRLVLDGDQYHLGHVFTEKEAFDLGFHAPHLDTICGKMGQIINANWLSDDLEEKLREEGLITDDQTLFMKNGVHVVSKEERDRYMWGFEPRGLNNANRPITLYVFNPKEGHIPVGCAAFVESVNGIYEFMTYPPVLERE